MIDLTKGDTALITDVCEKRGLLRNQTAYVLATVHWETARTMKPINEAGGPVYFKRMYDITGNRPSVAKRLGNTERGDGVRFHGRGYVQITGRGNYKRAGDEIGVDLIARPEDALKPEYAAQILVAGMSESWFTGKKLDDYITLQRSYFREARQIVNGTDKWDDIAAIADRYDRALIGIGFGVFGEPQTIPKPRPKPVVDIPPAPPPKPSPPPGAPPGVNQSFWDRLAAFIGRFFRIGQ